MSTSNMSNKKIKSHRIDSMANKKIEMEEFRVKNYKNYFLTSESVTKGHPDKVADLIADSILDEYLKGDKNSRVAVETLISNNKVTVARQVNSNTKVDIEKIVRNTLKNVEYNNSEVTMDYKTCDVEVNLTEQSKDVAMGVDDGGAGDQGIIFGYATDETEEYMPYPISLAHKLSRKIDEVRENKILPYLKSDGKVQVTVEYINDTPIRVDTILISVQHAKDVNIIQLQKDILEEVILETVDPEMLDIETKFYINPTGRFVIGGAKADTGLTGRKIIVDTYGGIARHGGGAFSGKDATKIDRSGAYMLRHIAKNVVANGLARKCEIQMSYGIGLRYPLSIYIDCFGTNRIPEGLIIKLIKERFDLTPRGIIDYLRLQEPIYAKTTNYGHFGREEFNWEKIIQI